MYEAMVLIKQELGNDAVIISKREVRQKGLLGFFKKKRLEVTAATDVVARPTNGITKKTDTRVSETITPTSTTPPVHTQAPAPVYTPEPPPVAATNQSTVEKPVDPELKEEVQQIKDIVEKLIQKSDSDQIQNESVNLVKDLMIEMDLHSKVIQDFESYCKDQSIESEKISKSILYEFIQQRFNEKVNVMDVGGRIKTFIGPTGVGKTTTIAKLASNEALVNQKSIGLITIDTYRIGAVEQLKIYANILGIPVKVVFSPEDIKEAIEYFSDKDLIYIDSTGRSHKNIHQLNELKSYLDQCENIKTYLVLSLGTKNIDFIKTIENYKKIGFDSLILTKMDETYSAGNILNASYFTDKPISYISKGQVVPDDIENASKDTLLEYIWGESR